MDNYSNLGDDLESSVSVHSVGGKATPVQCKHPLGSTSPAKTAESGVREIHRDVSVLFHQDRDSLKTLVLETKAPIERRL